jgi:acetyltransferase-like isoleucine patch superfamily enzyme
VLRKALKRLTVSVAVALALPLALLSGFGRLGVLFELGAQLLALVPGLPGSYLRVAYYKLTLEHVGPDCSIALGSFFAHSQASMGKHVGIGAYCVLGHVSIGDGTIFASNAQVLSGVGQHQRDEKGFLTDAGRGFERITIGQACWIGAGAVIMADLGDMVTVSPGSVVSNPAASGVLLAGNPARQVLRVAGKKETLHSSANV